MLTQAFNEQVNFQAKAHAVLRDKAHEHNLEAHHHTLKGHDFVIPKNAAIGIADGGKLGYKKDEKFKKFFDHIMRMQKLMGELDAGFGRLDDILDKMEANDQELSGLINVMNTNGIEDDRAYIEETYGVDTMDLTDQQVVEWEIEKGRELINNQQQYDAAYQREMQNINDKINQLPENSEERASATDRRGRIEARYINLAHERGYKFEQAADKANQNIKGLKQSKEIEAAIESKDIDLQSDERTDFRKDTNEVAETYDDMVQDFAVNDSPFPEVEGVLTDGFNLAANGENPFEEALEESLDNGVELSAVSETTKPLTMG